MFEAGRRVDFQKHSDACRSSTSTDRCRLPFLSQPFCPTANVRRQHTRNRLTKHSNTRRTLTRSSRSRAVIDSLEIVGKNLHVGSEEVSLSRTRCEQLAAFYDELRLLPCTDHYDSAAKFHTNSTTHLSVGNTDERSNCNGCRPDSCVSDEKLFIEDCSHSICQPCPCPTCRQQAPSLNELGKANECAEADGAEPKIPCNSAGTYRNVRIDQNRLLKLLRKFDAIRQGARAAREACLLRFEMRQKQRLHLLDLVDSEYQHQQFISNNKPPSTENDGTATTPATWNDIEVNGGRTVDVKPRDIIDLCCPARSDNFDTTWPPLLDDETKNVEPTDAVIGRLMSQFEQIRLDSATARLENQKRFENKRKQRKYKTQFLETTDS